MCMEQSVWIFQHFHGCHSAHGVLLGRLDALLAALGLLSSLLYPLGKAALCQRSSGEWFALDIVAINVNCVGFGWGCRV
jgi:hypothetical protein